VSETSGHPYEALGPDQVLDAVESSGVICDGRLLALNSYENRVYQVGLEDGSMVVAKFYRPGRWSDQAILEEHAFSTELDELEIPVVAPLPLGDSATTLGVAGPFRFALFPRRPGRWPELTTADERQQMGRFLGRMHAVGRLTRFEHRHRLDMQSYGFGPLEALEASDCIPQDYRPNFMAAARELLDAVAERWEYMMLPIQRIHADFHLGNVLWANGGPNVVDLDDCCMGPAVQDLWMLLDGSRDQREGQLRDVLAGYEEFCWFDSTELVAIESLRALRMVRYNGWLAARWDDPAFQLAFPWFTSPRYWDEQIVALREQREQLDEPALKAF
jgi:Ser/Thr protein kinase RdoA (MazF antagonist)